MTLLPSAYPLRLQTAGGTIQGPYCALTLTLTSRLDSTRLDLNSNSNSEPIPSAHHTPGPSPYSYPIPKPIPKITRPPIVHHQQHNRSWGEHDVAGDLRQVNGRGVEVINGAGRVGLRQLD